MLNIDDEYTAFCFNEACVSILLHIENDEKPMYVECDQSEDKVLEYKSMEDYYRSMGME